MPFCEPTPTRASTSGDFLRSPYLSTPPYVSCFSPSFPCIGHTIATFKCSFFFTSDLNRCFGATSAPLSTETQPRDGSVFHLIIRLRFVFGRADSSTGVMIAVLLASWSSNTAEQVIAHAARPLLLQQGHSRPNSLWLLLLLLVGWRHLLCSYDRCWLPVCLLCFALHFCRALFLCPSFFRFLFPFLGLCCYHSIITCRFLLFPPLAAAPPPALAPLLMMRSSGWVGDHDRCFLVWPLYRLCSCRRSSVLLLLRLLSLLRRHTFFYLYGFQCPILAATVLLLLYCC